MKRLTQKERRADVHNRIQLGGLVVKAGLDQETSAAIAGDKGEAERRRFHRIGDRAFSEPA
jgi:hypothetical protein